MSCKIRLKQGETEIEVEGTTEWTEKKFEELRKKYTKAEGEV